MLISKMESQTTNFWSKYTTFFYIKALFIYLQSLRTLLASFSTNISSSPAHSLFNRFRKIGTKQRYKVLHEPDYICKFKAQTIATSIIFYLFKENFKVAFQIYEKMFCSKAEFPKQRGIGMT